MDFTGEYKVPASRDKVWEALNDVDVLKLCIDGCEELNKDTDTEFSAKVTAKVGPVRAKFTGKVTLSDIDPPNGYTISGEGQGGVAGFAKGGAIVKLEDGEGATILHYEAKAEVGGKLASVGSRLVEGVAKKTADDFFGKFVEIVSDGDVDPALEFAGAKQDGKLDDSSHAQTLFGGGGMPPIVWGIGIVSVVVVLLIIFGK